MSLDVSEIAAVLENLVPDITGASVEKLILPARGIDRLALKLRSGGKSEFLLIVLEHGLTRIHRVTKRFESRPVPGDFVQLLRKKFKGSVIDDVSQPGMDRLVVIDFVRGDERARLFIELTGRHANLFLAEADGTIISSLLPNKSHKRKLVPGRQYAPPIPRPEGIRPSASGRFSEENIEAEIESLYVSKENATWGRAWKNHHISGIRKKLKRKRRLRKAIGGDIEAALKAQEHHHLAELLKINLGSLKKGMTHIEVPDVFVNPPKTVRIELSPALTPVQNMQKLFHASGRYAKALPRIRRRLEKVDEEISGLEEEIIRLEKMSAEEFLKLSKGPEKDIEHPPPARTAPHAPLPYRRFKSRADYTIRVGRNAAANDALTLHHSGLDDAWLHVREVAGSHVTVPFSGKGEVPADVIIDAAHLAVHFSSLRDEAGADVVVTRRRYVVKKKKSPPGQVHLLKEKVIDLRLQPETLSRLLENEIKS